MRRYPGKRRRSEARWLPCFAAGPFGINPFRGCGSVGELFERLSSFENVYSAYRKARKAKSFKGYVLEFERDLESNLVSLQRELAEGSYVHGGYWEKIVRDSKPRKIRVANFRDRVVHHAICNVIDELFESGFSFDSFACRKGKGTHKAVKRLAGFLKGRKPAYCLQCDVSKFFASIDHEILFGLLCRKIWDERVRGLARMVIDSSFDNEVFDGELERLRRTGVPLGNVTSQFFANVYLNELDKFIKHTVGGGG